MSARTPLLVAGTLAGLLAPGLASPAVADEGDPVTGWWSRTRVGAPSPVEAPDTVPEGGLQIAGGPTGRISVSALRAELPADVRATALTLDVAQARGTAAVTVCAVAAVWAPVEGGRLDEAPPEDCTLPATGTVVDGRLVVTLDPASPAGPLDVVLLPADGAVFSLDLQRPTAGTVSVEPVISQEAPPPAAGEVETGAGTDPDSVPEPSGDAAILDVPPFAVVDALPPALGSGTALAAPLVAGELPALPGAVAPAPAPTPAPATAPRIAFAPVPVAQTPLDDRRHAVPAALLLAVLIAFAMRLQAEPARAPRALGGAARARPADGTPVLDAPNGAVVPVRGVGRFRRPRPELLTASAGGREHGVGRFRRTRSEAPTRL